MIFSLFYLFKSPLLLFYFIFIINNKSIVESVNKKNVNLNRPNQFDKEKKEWLNKNLILNKNHQIPVVNYKKRNENYCPNEYRMCFCDNTNINPIANIQNLKLNGFKIQQPFSIMIDCRPSSKINGSILMYIPKILGANSVTNKKTKYLQHVTYLDLSNTEIIEVPSDAFQVYTSIIDHNIL